MNYNYTLCYCWQDFTHTKDIYKDMETREKTTNLSDNVVLTLLVRTKGVRESSLEAEIKPVEELWLSPPPLLREISMDSQLV